MKIFRGRGSPESGTAVADRLAEVSLAVYEKARRLGEEKGIIIADTKFEFGFQDGS